MAPGRVVSVNLGLAVLVLALAVGGGGVGWMRATQTLRRRTRVPRDRPPGMGRHDYVRRMRRQLRLRRYLLTLLYAGASVLGGLVLLLGLTRH